MVSMSEIAQVPLQMSYPRKRAVLYGLVAAGCLALHAYLTWGEPKEYGRATLLAVSQICGVGIWTVRWRGKASMMLVAVTAVLLFASVIGSRFAGMVVPSSFVSSDLGALVLLVLFRLIDHFTRPEMPLERES